MTNFDALLAGTLITAFGSPMLAVGAGIIAWIALLAILRVPAEISLASAGLFILLFTLPYVGDVVANPTRFLPSEFNFVIAIGAAILIGYMFIKVFGGRF